jgi:alkane 1-monooxygenase
MPKQLEHSGFLLAFVFPVIALAGYVVQAPWVFLGVAVLWLLVLQALDAFAGHDRPVEWRTLTARITPPSAAFPVENLALYGYVVLHVVVVGLGAWEFSRSDDVLPWMLFAIPVALSGATALIVAHELLHGSTRLDRWFGRLASIPAFWTVHEYEHLFLHHRDDSFCTEGDVAAAKLNQSYYSYLFRSVFANYRHAWQLQRDVLTKRGKNLVAARILVVIYLPPIVAAALVAVLWGGWALMFFLVQGFLTVAVFLLGTYNQHYGLIRRVGADGSPEAYNYMNIWSADQRATNLAFWCVGRHAHHHLDPFRSYTKLAVIDSSPILPYGYPTSMMFSLLPPLWFRLMNPRVAEVFTRRDELQAQGYL